MRELAKQEETKMATIQTKKSDEICHDDSAPPVKASTVDELHSLQKKKTSLPTTPKADADRSKQQLQSIRYPLFPILFDRLKSWAELMEKQ